MTDDESGLLLTVVSRWLNDVGADNLPDGVYDLRHALKAAGHGFA